MNVEGRPLESTEADYARALRLARDLRRVLEGHAADQRFQAQLARSLGNSLVDALEQLVPRA